MAGEQLNVLNALDVAKTQWYHFTAIVIAGMGFFTDAYDLFCISLVTKLLGRIYYYKEGSTSPGSLPSNVSAAVNGVAFAAPLQASFSLAGFGDKMGRKRVYGMTLMLMVISAIASGLSFGKAPTAVMSTLCFFRFWLGFGIGGDYPLSATIMSEYANKKTRGAFIAAVFAMQGFGILAGGMVAIIVSGAFKVKYPAQPYENDPVGSTVPEADYVWRIILMFGAIPAAVTYYWRMKMPETARYTALVAKNAKQAASDMAKVLQCYWVDSSGSNLNAIEEVYRIARAQTLIALCPRHRIGFVIMYSLTFFFSNFGPNSTTFVVPAEIFPARLRSTCHGISAASGKAGAIVGAFGFLYAKDGIGVRNTLLVVGGINFFGMIFTLLVPESKGKSLEEMSGEAEEENQSHQTTSV
ncbi:hypothetical protein GH714_004603 [Hevea brasiliensis]|uniref:Major facilitator superfamily (MFS) profile domain-containing protein n=1 Tax=Hevea brasiliensis TaxID=3981 RepID=A0A6A6K9G9_HEVBR|nr:hypothetical protein GH714_004603 [Hevea brasiliensis]